jgi:hypothetical protein
LYFCNVVNFVFYLYRYLLGAQTSKHSQEHLDYGGERLTTFMIYLSDVEAGHTVFSTLGLFIKPKAGDAAFWFNLDSRGIYDSRNFHLGCPVLYGNKWIANKWVKWSDQMWNYPCLVDGGPFNIDHFLMTQ